MYARVFYLKNPQRVDRLARSIAPLFDSKREDLKGKDFWQEGTYFTHPKRSKAAVVILRPDRGLDPVTLGRAATRLLEARHGLALDWAGGIRDSGIWLVIKTLATDAQGAGRNRELRLDRDDLGALRDLAPGGRWGRED
jgi:hypothetical protein